MADRQPTKKEEFRRKVITGHRARMEDQRREWAEAVRAYQSEFYGNEQLETPNGEEDALVVENNWLFAFAETMVANIVPTNPQVTINYRRQGLETAAKYREALCNDFMVRGKVHAKLTKAGTRAVIYPRVFLKMVWNKTRCMPRLRVINPEYIFFDLTAEDWEDIRYVIEAVPMTRAQFEERVGKKGKRGVNYRTDAAKHAKFGKYPDWLKADSDMDSDHQVASENFEWITVYEYYDLVEKKLYHMIEEDSIPLYEGPLPYFFCDNPYYMISYNDNLQDLGGLSDAKLAMPTIKALNELSTLQLQHIQATIPKIVVHEGLLDDPDEFYTALAEAVSPLDAIPLRAKQNATVDQIMGSTPTPSLPVAFPQAKAELRELIEFILGIASYQRGGLGQSDVATELALSDTAIRTRNARRQKIIYGAIEWICEALLALYMQYMEDEEKVAMRLGIDDEVSLVSREDLGLGARLTEDDDDDEVEARKKDIFGYDYIARPYNAQESNSIAQLKMLTDYAQLLINNPNVDQRRFVEKLLELIHMENILLPKEQAQAQAQAAAAAQGGAPASGPPAPQGAPAEMAAMIQGGNAEGAQAVPGGMEGGPQPGGNTLQ